MDKLQRISGSHWYNHWAHRGHVFGQCVTNNDHDWLHVNIPKNASVSANDLLINNLGWQHSNFHTDESLTGRRAIIFLRDPIDRWVSGICEYFYRNYEQFGCTTLDGIFEKLTPAMLDLIFSRVAFDEHTEKQVYFLEGLDLARAVFFRVEPGVMSKVMYFMHDHGMISDTEHRELGAMAFHSNPTTDVPAKARLLDMFKKCLCDPRTGMYITQGKCYQNLQEYYEQDIKLYHTVKYSG